MNVTIKEKIDALVNEVMSDTNLNNKMEHLYYMLRQADSCIFSLEEEQRQYENSGNY